MSISASQAITIPGDASASPRRALRKLFLMLFLRGRASRGLKKEKAPTSIARKLALNLLFYFLFGFVALSLFRQGIFTIAVYLHCMTFIFLGMFIVASAGELLFNKEEADILLHRPIDPATLLWAKIRVLIEVSLWLAIAFNLAGLGIGTFGVNGNWLFPFAHLISTALEALFCIACVVLVYQLCFRWLGRERLDGLMTLAQVLVSVILVLSGQLVQFLMPNMSTAAVSEMEIGWIGFFPPAWFAAFDDAIAGSGSGTSWMLGGLAVAATALMVWLAFSKLAKDYQSGLQAMGETVSIRRPRRKVEWTPPVDRQAGEFSTLVLVSARSITRASFLLTSAYILRDRDTRLRLFPAIAPMVAVPLVSLLQRYMNPGNGMSMNENPFSVGFVTSFLGMIPLMSVLMLQYSQDWQASDVFRAAPVHGPGAVCAGARWAVSCFLTIPFVCVMAIITWMLLVDRSQILLLLPGIIALPVCAIVPQRGGAAVPLSMPVEEAKSAGRSWIILCVMIGSMILSGIAAAAWAFGWFWWFILAELILVAAIYVGLRASVNAARWASVE